jgi:uncharacterized protein (UPF0335 family)
MTKRIVVNSEEIPEMTKRIIAAGDNSIDAKALQSFVERLENLDQERTALVDDMKDVKKEAKDSGLDPKTLDKILKLRKMDKELRRVEREMLDAYLAALGME